MMYYFPLALISLTPSHHASGLNSSVQAYVVPVSLTLLEHGTLKLERSLPRATLAGVLILSKRKLASVIIPGAQKVDGLDGGGGAEVE